MCLLSWDSAMKPVLPLITAPQPPRDKYEFEGDHSHIQSKDLDSAKADAATSMQTGQYPANLAGGQQGGYDVDYATEKKNNEEGLHEQGRDGKLKAITKHLSTFLRDVFF